MLELRNYQREGVDALYNYWQRGGGNALLVYPTGAGKSLVAATIVRELLEKWPEMRIGIVTHVRELILQNFQELMRLWPQAPAGIYSAGLGRRDHHARIMFLGIQSVWNKTDRLGAFDLLIVDEAHLIPRAASSMYGKFIDKLRNQVPDLRIVGLTATPFRLDTGRLHEGEEALFDDVVYECSIPELVSQGYLAPLISRSGSTEVDVSGVTVRGGEFVAGELEAASMNDELVNKAVAEFVALGADRRAWLVFCTGVAHAAKVRDAIRSHGVSCETITGETDKGTRDRVINSFRQGNIRALTSVAVLTTGFNVPHVDMICLLRPTLSTGLYVQQVGRGFRIANGKQNCLVLDYAGVIRRHGPIDCVSVSVKKKDGDNGIEKVKPETVRAKICPNCQSFNSISALTCQMCGFAWPEDSIKHGVEAEAIPIMSKDVQKWLPVRDVLLDKHKKMDSPDSLRVEYVCGMQTFREWTCPEHGGFIRSKFEAWWRSLSGKLPCPNTVDEAMRRAAELDLAESITAVKEGKFHRVVSRRVRRPNGALIEIDDRFRCKLVDETQEVAA